MNHICEKIKSFLKKYQIDNDTLTYLVAFSGGFDSMCLLHALKKVAPKNKIVALHLNHKWRGEESDVEEKNCREFCKKIGVEIHCENLNDKTPQTETAAREERYKFFERCAEKYNSKIVFTAHNKNDNAETLIYRICMGTGVSGLQGICTNRGIFYRPLLEIARENIENYCKKNSLNPNSDSSNSNTKYKRNYIRAEILPKLQQINPDSIEKINSLSEIARDESEIISEYIELILNKISDDNKIKTKKFFKYSESIQKRILYKVFLDNNLEYDKTKILYIKEFLKENCESKSGKISSLTNNLWIFINSEYIEVISENKIAPPYFHILKEGKYEDENYIFELEKFEKTIRKFPKESENYAYVDLSKFEMNFEIRTRQDGDIISPFGMKGSQKLKKYLNAKKIPNHEKENLIFLAQDNEILWAINLGINDKIKVLNKPTHIIKFYKKEQ